MSLWTRKPRMKIRVSQREISEEGIPVMFSSDLTVTSWDDAFEQGRVFRLWVDGISMGVGRAHEEMTGDDEVIGRA